MSDPQRPAEPGHPPIADAAAMFDSNEVYSYNPPPDAAAPTSTPAPADDDSSSYGIDALPSTPAPSRPAPAAPPRAAKPKPKPNTAGSSRYFDPSDDDEPAVAAGGEGPSDSAIRAARRSRHDVDPESDSSDRAPRRTGKRKSERAIGFDEVDDSDDAPSVPAAAAGAVDPPWTRGAEWGPDLARVGLVGLATLVVAYLASGSIGSVILVLLLGGAAAVLLSYPILVTLERPVRMTPQQAVDFFFEAAGHRFPHYRRMWLLVTPRARGAGRLPSFGEFRAHWARRMSGWKQGKAGSFAPLTFRVTDFRGDKSVGQTTVEVGYSVQVFVRGQESGAPINSYKVKHGMTRGDDRMWYLDQAILASASR